MKIRELFLFCFYDVHKENLFRTNLEDGREAPSKASNIIYWKHEKNLPIPKKNISFREKAAITICMDHIYSIFRPSELITIFMDHIYSIFRPSELITPCKVQKN